MKLERGEHRGCGVDFVRVPEPWQFLPVGLMAHVGVQFVSRNSAKQMTEAPQSRPGTSM